MHYVREQVATGFLTTAQVSSNQQLADVLTKALPSTQHHSICSKLGLLTQVQLEGVYKLYIIITKYWALGYVGLLGLSCINRRRKLVVRASTMGWV